MGLIKTNLAVVPWSDGSVVHMVCCCLARLLCLYACRHNANLATAVNLTTTQHTGDNVFIQMEQPEVFKIDFNVFIITNLSL